MMLFPLLSILTCFLDQNKSACVLEHADGLQKLIYNLWAAISCETCRCNHVGFACICKLPL